MKAVTRADRRLWRAKRATAATLGLAATAGLALIGLVSAYFLIALPASFWSLGLLLLALVGLIGAAISAALTYGVWFLTYELDQSALVIHWLGQRFVVAYDGIDAIYGGKRLGETRGPRPLSVAGYRIGEGWAHGVGQVTFYTTSVEEEDIAVVATLSGVFALSPEDPAAFRRALISRVQEDEVAGQHVLPTERRLVPEAVLDRLALVPLGLAALLWLVLTGLLLGRFEALPEQVPLGFGTGGEPRLGERAGLWLIPALGALVLLANAVLGAFLVRREALLARLIWIATPVVLVMLLIAAVRLSA